MTDHPITPPPELVEQWRSEPEYGTPGRVTLHTISEQRLFQLLTRSAQWGYEQRGEVNEAKLQQARDQELEACIAWFDKHIPGYELVADKLRAARRPKPQTLSSIALQTLDTIERDAHYLPEITDTIRRAILRLKQLEDSNG